MPGVTSSPKSWSKELHRRLTGSPVLKLLPEFMAPWKVWAKAVTKQQKNLYLSLLRETRRAYGNRGKGPVCFSASDATRPREERHGR